MEKGGLRSLYESGNYSGQTNRENDSGPETCIFWAHSKGFPSPSVHWPVRHYKGLFLLSLSPHRLILSLAHLSTSSRPPHHLSLPTHLVSSLSLLSLPTRCANTQDVQKKAGAARCSNAKMCVQMSRCAATMQDVQMPRCSTAQNVQMLQKEAAAEQPMRAGKGFDLTKRSGAKCSHSTLTVCFHPNLNEEKRRLSWGFALQSPGTVDACGPSPVVPNSLPTQPRHFASPFHFVQTNVQQGEAGFEGVVTE